MTTQPHIINIVKATISRALAYKAQAYGDLTAIHFINLVKASATSGASQLTMTNLADVIITPFSPPPT